MPLRAIPFVVVDTETTGLDVKNDHLLSVAAMRVHNFSIDLADQFTVFIKQENYIPGESVQVHGILARHAKEGLDEKSMCTRFLEFIRDNIIVGHHIAFDLQMLNKALLKHFGIKMQNKILDTGQLARRIENPMSSRGKQQSLDVLCQQYAIPIHQRHTAGGDTFLTALIFLKQLGRLERKGVHTRNALL